MSIAAAVELRRCPAQQLTTSGDTAKPVASCGGLGVTGEGGKRKERNNGIAGSDFLSLDKVRAFLWCECFGERLRLCSGKNSFSPIVADRKVDPDRGNSMHYQPPTFLHAFTALTLVFTLDCPT